VPSYLHESHHATRSRGRKERDGRCEDSLSGAVQAGSCVYTNLRCAATFNEMLIPRSDPAREETVVKRSQRKKIASLESARRFGLNFYSGINADYRVARKCLWIFRKKKTF